MEAPPLRISWKDEKEFENVRSFAGGYPVYMYSLNWNDSLSALYNAEQSVSAFDIFNTLCAFVYHLKEVDENTAYADILNLICFLKSESRFDLGSFKPSHMVETVFAIDLFKELFSENMLNIISVNSKRQIVFFMNADESGEVMQLVIDAMHADYRAAKWLPMDNGPIQFAAIDSFHHFST